MKIVVAYDGSECADEAVSDLARAGLPEGSELTVVSVCETWLPPVSSLEFVGGITAFEEFGVLVRRAAGRLHDLNPKWKITTELSIGSAGSVVVEKADECHPDLIVVGSHGHRGLGRLLFGSVSQYILHHARYSVRIGRKAPGPRSPNQRLIVGIDGSKHATAAVEAVAKRKWPAGTEVRLVNGAWKIPMAASEPMLAQITAAVARERTWVQEALDKATETLTQAGLAVSVVVRDEEPRHLLCREAEEWDADCIFVGSRGTGRLERLLIGSISSSVAARANCTVEVVRAPG